MRSVAFLAVVLVTLSCLTPPASGRDIFVSNTAGDNRFSGRALQTVSKLDGPVRTIGRALALAARGDRIVLENTGEPYRESISLVGGRHSGYSYAPFTIEGSGATLNGSAIVPGEAWEHYRGGVFRFRPPHSGSQQLFLDDRPAPRVRADRMAPEPPQLEAGQWCLWEGSIYFRVDPLKLPEDYALTYAAQRVGITLFHVDRVKIFNLTVEGFQLDGINANNSARNVSLFQVTCRGNGRSGVSVGGACSVRIEACLLGDNGQAQLLTHPLSQTHLEGSQLLSLTAPGWVDEGGRVFIDGKPIEGGLEELAPDGS